MRLAPSALTTLLLCALCSSTLAAEKKPGASIVWVNQASDRQLPLPARTTHRTFSSKLAGEDIGYCLYLPEAYHANSDTRFPVIYNLHGNGGNEFTSVDSIRLLDQQITEGIVPPMIMVLPNGGHSTFYKDSADGKFPIESIFIREFIPMIDANYRTIARKEGRCIEGFSMGGRGSTRLVAKYPQMFCSLFCQAGNVPALLDIYDQAPKEDRAGLLLGDNRQNWEENDVYALAEKNLAALKKVRIRIACGTKDSGHLKTVRAFHHHLLKLGIDHTYIELEGLGHKRNEMMQRMGPIWFAYHVESLRQSGAIARGQ
ncbi:MAG: alpha/beta hydrolase [Rubripirellula sp.]